MTFLERLKKILSFDDYRKENLKKQNEELEAMKREQAEFLEYLKESREFFEEHNKIRKELELEQDRLYEEHRRAYEEQEKFLEEQRKAIEERDRVLAEQEKQIKELERKVEDRVAEARKLSNEYEETKGQAISLLSEYKAIIARNEIRIANTNNPSIIQEYTEKNKKLLRVVSQIENALEENERLEKERMAEREKPYGSLNEE